MLQTMSNRLLLLEWQRQRWLRVLLGALRDERAEEGTTSNVLRNMLTALGVFAVVGVIWAALNRAGINVAGLIDGSAGWAP